MNAAQEGACCLALFGLGLTALTAEICRYGYVPSQEEIGLGQVDPYSIGGACDGAYANKLWTCQAIISFSTVLLGATVREKDKSNDHLLHSRALFGKCVRAAKDGALD